jgi:hypothetical protein
MTWVVDEAHSFLAMSDETSEQPSNALFLTLSAEEIGKVAVLIIRGVEHSEAIRSMPRYTRRQHREYAAFFDQLKEAMTGALRDR